jgi:hypothetical protein
VRDSRAGETSDEATAKPPLRAEWTSKMSAQRLRNARAIFRTNPAIGVEDGLAEPTGLSEHLKTADETVWRV